MPIHPDDDTGALEEARERLYTPRGAPVDMRRPLSPERPRQVSHAWLAPLARIAPRAHPHVRLALVFFIAAGFFFIVASGVAAFLFLSGSNSVSTNNIAITIQGPTTIAGGDTVPLSLTITNKNPISIENATLEIDFPTGTRSATNVADDYPRYVENLGTLTAGQTVTRQVEATIFGGAGQALALPVSLTYSTEGSNALFVKQSSYALSVSSAPLSLSIAAPTSVVSGQPYTLDVTVRSNATTPLSGIVLAAQFPFGFSVVKTSVPQSGSDFVLGTLAPGASQDIQIQGVLVGQENDARVFTMSVGTATSATDPTLAVSYMQQQQSVTIEAPFINVGLAVNGDTSAAPVVSAGSPVSGTLTWTNTLSVPVTNASISIAVSGNGIQPGSVTSSRGFYQSQNQTITFDSTSDPSLATLAPGASGIGSFTFQAASGNVRNPQVVFAISISGTRADQSGTLQQVTSTLVETAKVATSVTLSANVTHATGPFTNAGPIPPVPNTPTDYTIIWSASGSANDVGGSTVTATLPSYVTYTGATNPSNGFSYDTQSRTVTWNVGDLAAGATAVGAFQVALAPSTSQAGTAPTLTSPATFSGVDRYAQTSVSATAAQVTTETPNDPGYVPADSNVQ